ncbi:MAG: S-layer homology domain-containing protein [Bacillota bacterium]
MRKKVIRIILPAIIVLLLGTVFAGQAAARPEFAAKTGKSCNFCHGEIPALNSTGKQFKANGYSLVAPKPTTTTTKTGTNTTTTTKTTQPKFSDMNKHWAKTQVEFLAGKKIINGYPDGTFRPVKTITQSEFAMLVRRVGNIKLNSSQGAYLLPYASSKTPIDRETAAEIIVRAIGSDAAALALPMQEMRNLLSLVKDGDSVSDAKAPFVAQALKRELIKGYADKTLQPQKTLTRAEAAVLVYTYFNAR